MDTDAAAGDDVARMLGRLLDPPLGELAGRLRAHRTLSQAERDAIRAGLARALRTVVWRHVCRVVVLELHVARRAGRLTAAGSRARWSEWLDHLGRSAGWAELTGLYPALAPRLDTLIRNRCAAALRLALRFGADRAALANLPGGGPGELTGVEFGAGDSHRGGQSTTVLHGGAGRLVYKPRSLAVDAALGALLPRLLPEEPPATRIRVPAVLTRQDAAGAYGWAEHVAHRHCVDEAELRTFYRGLGHWLAVLRLLSGSDLHAENLIAAGPVPVVVDCETLFTPPPAPAASGYGDAVDLAAERIGGSVLATGLLPTRGGGLGRRGVDLSGAGALPGEQPAQQVPGLVDQGTDDVRMGLVDLPAPRRENLPCADPDLRRFWEQVVTGFSELTDRLRRLDRAGELAGLLVPFADCPIRVVLRDTGAYAELGHMLWHPSSLHRPEPAVERATDLLARQAERLPRAPADPAVIAAEVADLQDGDIPLFTTTPRSGELTGPRGTRCGEPRDLTAAALARWRAADPAVDRRIIRGTLVSAYLDDWRPRPAPVPVRADDVDRRRRAQAAGAVRQIASEAIRGDDGTVTWVAPGFGPTGWGVQALPADIYCGLVGVTVVLAGYRSEMRAGRADDVPEVETLLPACVRTLRRGDDQQRTDRAKAQAAGIEARPEPPGGYVGLGSRIWGWLLLHALGAVAADEATQRAAALAGCLADAVAADEAYDLLVGSAGAVVPLLRLAEQTGDDAWVKLAVEIGHRLQAAARVDDAGARWPTRQFPDGLGGLAHGATGIGWALFRLAAAPPVAGTPVSVVFRALADAAFRWEESLYVPGRPGWRDLRERQRVGCADAWCHGSVGIGLVAADLLADADDERWRDLVRRAAAAARVSGLGRSNSLCHGDLGAWELLYRVSRTGFGPPGLAPERVVAEVVSSLEVYGPVTGAARDVFEPGLLLGAGGVAYQLLRMHLECRLPSVLLPDVRSA